MKKTHISVRESVIFALLGALFFVSRFLMQWAPNIHPLALLILACTAVYRVKALIPLYVYVLLEGIFSGFGLWWIPYLYIWTILWAAGMLVPVNASKRKKAVLYALIAFLHGFLFGTLYAPVQALMFGLDFKGMIAWIVAGLPWDALHAAGDLVFGLFVVPLSETLRKIDGIRP